MKKFLIYIFIFGLLLSLSGCSDKNVEMSDALKFKKEYESVNGQELYGKNARELKIPEDNPFVYATADEIVEMIDNGETFAVYFGFSTCPWCRAALSTLIDVCDDLNMNKIYYVDVKDIRNVLEVKDDEIVTKTEGSKGYMDLLDRLDDVLDNYSLTDEDGKEIDTKMNRIYAPNIVSVVNGKAESMTTATSDKLEDPYDEITDDIYKEVYDMIECTLKCVSSTKKVCDRSC